jgi:F-type H+-transporting ATPase subunit alpha
LRKIFEFFNNKHRATLDALKAGKLTDEITDVIQTVAKEISAKYN